MMIRLAVCAFIAIGVVASIARAEENAGIIEVIGRPLVEGTEVSRYGDSVVRVGGDQVADQNASDLATALSKVPGVTFSRHNIVGAYGGGDGGAIYIRGHGSSRPGAEIGTLVDSVPRFSGIWGHPLLDMLPVDAAAAIDVYKSVQPALLGNMSFGALNVIPKRVIVEGSESRAVFALGSFNTWTGVFEHGTRTGALDYYFVGSQRSSEGHRDDAGGIVWYLYGRVGIDLGANWHVSVQSHHSDGNAEDPRAEGAELFFTPERFITRGDLSILTIENDHGSSKGSIKFYRDDGVQNWEQWADGGTKSIVDDTPGDWSDDEPFRSLSDYLNYGVRARQAFAPWQGGEVVVGLDHDVYGGHFIEESADPSVSPNIPYDIDMANTAPYVLLSHEFDMGWKITPSAGARWNEHDTFGGELGWQAGLKLDRGPLTLHAHYAQSVNYAGVFAGILFGGTGLGTLEPERIAHVEAGAEYRIAPRMKISITAYQDDVTDAIRVVAPPPTYENIGAYTSRGVELALEATAGRTADIFVGATYSDNDPSDLPYSPRLSAVVGAEWRASDRLRLTTALNYFDEQYVGNPRSPNPNVLIDAYATVNARIGYRYTDTLDPTRGEVFLAVDNLTNTKYELKPDYPMPGVTFTAGMDVKF